MKRITISTPDGKTITLNAPDGASPDQIKQAASRAISQYKLSNPGTSPEKQSQPAAPEKPDLMHQGWDALAKPAEMSKEGLNQMTDLGVRGQNAVAEKTGLPIGTEPTGNMARDIVANVPRIAGETISEVAPSFIDRTSILTAGAGMAAKGVGKVGGAVISKLAPMLEAGSGLGKGTLVAAFKDPKMIMDFGGKLKASKLYDAIKEGASVPAKLRTNAQVVDNAIIKMAKGYTLTAPDAFKARKAVKALMKSKQYPMDDLIKTKEGLDAMVFGSVSKADQMYVRAIRGENMRNLARLNNSGTTGPGGLAALALLPTWAKALGSPALQGGAASLAGAAAQMNPTNIMNTGAMVGAGLDRLRKKEKNRGKR